MTHLVRSRTRQDSQNIRFTVLGSSQWTLNLLVTPARLPHILWSPLVLQPLPQQPAAPRPDLTAPCLGCMKSLFLSQSPRRMQESTWPLWCMHTNLGQWGVEPVDECPVFLPFGQGTPRPILQGFLGILRGNSAAVGHRWSALQSLLLVPSSSSLLLVPSCS